MQARNARAQIHRSGESVDYFWASRNDPRFDGSDWDKNIVGRRQIDPGRNIYELPAQVHFWLRAQAARLGVEVPADLRWRAAVEGVPTKWRRYP